MLKRLYISNFTLIEEMDVRFPAGLTVITGETGAGKSIFLEAMALALGARADLDTLKNKTKKCIVEIEFKIRNSALSAFFEKHDIDFPSNEIILRREINNDGKSRSFINDSLTNLSALKEIAELLIDIHSQHQTLSLNDSEFQMDLLNAFAGVENQVAEFKTEFKHFNHLKLELNNLLELENNSKKEQDYFEFLYKEFENFEIVPGKLKILEDEIIVNENAEVIKANLLQASNAINNGENNLLQQLNSINQNINGIVKFNPIYTDFSERINSVSVELKDLANEFEMAESDVQYDAQRLEELNTEQDKINRLLKKHQAKTEEELIAIKNNLEQKLAQINSLENQINKLKKNIEAKESSCFKIANTLSKERKKAIPEIEKRIKEMLINLSMPNAEFKIELNVNTSLNANGIDVIRYLFSANKGSSLSELSRVASGGELSRLMLSLKSLLATKKELPTIVFDEIDTGVSGEVANKIGTILEDMSKALQIITITHLPQMASKGTHHLFVYKSDSKETTNSYIKEIKGEERIIEIAKMLSSGVPSPSAIKNAKELLMN